MDFLDRFSARDRERLASAARTVQLAPGEFLLRRGERGGDVFRVAAGELEVIDTRSQPAIILDVIRTGAVVGEMAFLDESPRSADVRAHEAATCQRWDRPALLRLLEEDPALASGFYRVIAELVSERVRTVQTNVVTGALSGAHAGKPEGDAAARAVGESLAASLRKALVAQEPALRRDRASAEEALRAQFTQFEAAVVDTLGRLEPREADEAGHALAHALEPYLMRAHLAEIALERSAAQRPDAARVAHVLSGLPEGDGPLGEVLDAWLVGLPTLRALASRHACACARIAAHVSDLPTDHAARAVVVNAGSGQLAHALGAALAGRKAEVALVHDDREELSALGAALGAHTDLSVRFAQHDLASLALGRSRLRFPARDLVILDGLLEYLPERAAASLLRWAAGQLAPGGLLVATTLVPSSDELLARHLLAWPTVRRPRPTLEALAHGAGLSGVEVLTEHAGATLIGRAPPAEPPASP